MAIKNKRLFYLISAFILFFTACSKEELGSPADGSDTQVKGTDWGSYPNDDAIPEHIPGQIVVLSKSGALDSSPFLMRLKKSGFMKAMQISALRGNDGSTDDLTVIDLHNSARMVDVLKQGQEEFGENMVGPNFVYHATAYNDYFLGNINLPTGETALYGIFNIKADMIWPTASGQGITVAVIDTGLDYNHPDIAANFYTNPDEIPGNGIDDDNNGKIDDIHGWNFISNNANIMDDNGHGSHCAGTVAGVGNNTIGVAGVAPNAKIMVVKVLNASGSGSTAGVIAGMNYAAASKAQVLSMSLGGPYDALSNAAANNAVAAGKVLIVAAGNENQNAANSSPASATQAITVAAVDSNNTKASFSNYGSIIDVAAPGVHTLSIKASSANFPSITGPDGSSYAYISGTSMATPHVAGYAALILSANPQLTPAQVDNIIKTTAMDLGTPGKDDLYGYGLINAQSGVQQAVAMNNNHPPVFGSVADPVSAEVGKKLDLILSVSDADGDTVTLTAQNLPSGSTFDPAQKKLSWTPNTSNALKTYTVKFTANDAHGGNVEKNVSIYVNKAQATPKNGLSTGVSPQGLKSNAGAVASGCAAGLEDRSSILGFFVILIIVAFATRRKSGTVAILFTVSTALFYSGCSQEFGSSGAKSIDGSSLTSENPEFPNPPKDPEPSPTPSEPSGSIETITCPEQLVIDEEQYIDNFYSVKVSGGPAVVSLSVDQSAIDAILDTYNEKGNFKVSFSPNIVTIPANSTANIPIIVSTIHPTLPTYSLSVPAMNQNGAYVVITVKTGTQTFTCSPKVIIQPIGHFVYDAVNKKIVLNNTVTSNVRYRKLTDMTDLHQSSILIELPAGFSGTYAIDHSVVSTLHGPWIDNNTGKVFIQGMVQKYAPLSSGYISVDGNKLNVEYMQ